MSHENEEDTVRRKSSFSLWRIAGGAGAAMLVVLSTVFLLEKNGVLDTRQNMAAAKEGSGRRRVSPFDLSNATVPKGEIHSGGPAKDGIPALSKPRLIAAGAATYLKPADRVIGVVIEGEARAYPIRILNYHEIVNDVLSGKPIAVTYCPLCDSAAAFDRETPRGLRDFGVSGLLYNSNVLMYDRDEKAESLWSQLRTEAVAGVQVRNRLKLLPLELTSWSDWQSRHPATTVLSSKTGHGRDYSHSPYDSYFSTPQLMFPVEPSSDRLPTKEKVLGVLAGGKMRAYPRSAFGQEQRRVEGELAGNRFVVEYNAEADSLRIIKADEGVTWVYSLWFSWYAMHPGTEVFPPQP